MLTNYLLCVLVVMLAYCIGEVGGKPVPRHKRLPSGGLAALSLFASLALGGILFAVALFLEATLREAGMF